MSADVIASSDTLAAGQAAIAAMLKKADGTSGAALVLHEDTDGGTNTVTITPGTTAISSNRTVSLPDADVNLGTVLSTLANITPASSGVPSQLTLKEDSDNGTSSFILIAPASLAADRTVTGPSGGDLNLESVRLLDAAWTDASASAAASLVFLEDTDNGTNKCTLIGPASAASDRTCTLPSGGDLDLENVRVLLARFTVASSGVPASVTFAEDTDNGTDAVTITAPSSLGGAVTLTLPTASLDLAEVAKHYNPLVETGKTLNVVDNDSAAAETQVFVVVEPQAPHLAYLASANAGTATVYVQNDEADAALAVVYNANPAANLGGVALYFDEDGTTQARFRANLASGFDAKIAMSDGRLINVVADATPGTEGVAVYIDDDAADATERLMFVSPTDTTGTEATHPTIAAFGAITTA